MENDQPKYTDLLERRFLNPRVSVFHNASTPGKFDAKAIIKLVLL